MCCCLQAVEFSPYVAATYAGQLIFISSLAFLTFDLQQQPYFGHGVNKEDRHTLCDYA